MKGHGSKFNHKMEEAVAALLTQKNQEEAARAVGILGSHATTVAEAAGVPTGIPGSPPRRSRASHRPAAARDQRGGLDFAEGHAGPGFDQSARRGQRAGPLGEIH